MHRMRVLRWSGFALACLIALSISTRPTMRASQSPATPASFGGVACDGGGYATKGTTASSAPVVHLAARPMTAEATKVWMKLQEKVAMEFPDDTPLAKVIKYIQAATVDKQGFPDGIPIYVSPIGLQDADKTMASTVAIQLKGIPLATTLKLALDQLGLTYHIHPDGLLVVTSKEDEGEPVEADALILDNLWALRAEVRALHAEVNLNRTGVAPGSNAADRHPANTPTGGMAAQGGFR